MTAQQVVQGSTRVVPPVGDANMSSSSQHSGRKWIFEEEAELRASPDSNSFLFLPSSAVLPDPISSEM